MLDESVPLLRLLVQRSVLAIGHNLNAVLKVEDFSDALDQIKGVTFVAGVALKVFAVFRFPVRENLEYFEKDIESK